MRKLFFAVFVVFFGLFSISCSREKPLELVMAESNPDDTISAKSDEVFVKAVEELSNGKIKIKLFTDSLLGDNSAVLNEMVKKESKIHLASMSTTAIARYGCKKTSLMDIPYTFKDRSHFWKFAESDIAKSILDEPYDNNTGIKGLFFTEEGFRHFFSTSRIATVNDFKGKKIRSAGQSVLTEVIKALDGNAVSINFSILYSAIQVGEADIAEQPIVNYLSNNFNKVAPFVLLDGHQLGIREIIVNSNFWDSLSKRQKQIIIDAGKITQEYCRNFSKATEEQAISRLKEEGTQFIPVDDISPWREACSQVIRNAASANPETFSSIINFSD